MEFLVTITLLTALVSTVCLGPSCECTGKLTVLFLSLCPLGFRRGMAFRISPHRVALDQSVCVITDHQ